MMVKRLKLPNFLMVWHERFPTHKHMGVGRGAGIWKFQQKTLFFMEW